MKKVLSLATAISLFGSSLLLGDTSNYPPSIPLGINVDIQIGVSFTGTGTSTTMTLGLTPGWNLVSIPGYSRYSLDDMFGVDITNSSKMAMVSFVNSVWVFDVNLGKWHTYIPGDRNDYFRSLKPGEGIWVDAKYNASYEFTATTVGEEKVRYKDEGGSGIIMDNVPPMPWDN